MSESMDRPITVTMVRESEHFLNVAIVDAAIDFVRESYKGMSGRMAAWEKLRKAVFAHPKWEED